MPTLHVALQEGFVGDRVVLKVNGTEVARREGVSTKNQIGLAETVECDVPRGPVDLDISVARDDLAAHLRVDVEVTPFVGVSIEGGALVLTPQGESFRYL